jgi:hypothetical protein
MRQRNDRVVVAKPGRPHPLWRLPVRLLALDQFLQDPLVADWADVDR